MAILAGETRSPARSVTRSLFIAAPVIALMFVLGTSTVVAYVPMEEIDLIGVTTVYADVQLRARMVNKMLSLRGVSDVPVHAGIGTPLMNIDPIYWPGHEGIGLLGPEDHATPDLPIDAVETGDAATARALVDTLADME